MIEADLARLLKQPIPEAAWSRPANSTNVVKARAIREAIAYLKTTPAVTLSGQGGAYELLEAYAKRMEKTE